MNCVCVSGMSILHFMVQFGDRPPLIQRNVTTICSTKARSRRFLLLRPSFEPFFILESSASEWKEQRAGLWGRPFHSQRSGDTIPPLSAQCGEGGVRAGGATWCGGSRRVARVTQRLSERACRSFVSPFNRDVKRHKDNSTARAEWSRGVNATLF